MSETEVEPTLEDLIRRVAIGEGEKQHGMLPAKVTVYNAAKQTCDAKPIVLIVIEGQARPLPVLRDIPIRYPAGSNWSLVGPLAPGDLVWLQPAGADISGWESSNAADALPVRQVRNSLSDLIAVPGGASPAAPLPATQYSSAGPVLFGQTAVFLGDSGATKVVALDTDTVHKSNAPPDSLAVWMTQVETAVNILAPGAITPLSTTFTQVGTITSTATKVKAK